ncbi:hypothetical protein PACTADRAFT_79427 [Pachysolen tannophilus NRRL Y-2460]|uniref:Hydantoinase/oxoprolinase N-terminal domain-containing protein n=1 Tax=Pachysolen tannophilus NRRL Y-2460 TaxID=669874 RepID=A0A1E4TZ30_PACTA|nr:hypothetical protein PACTADRAFT_79427 [Pachysolen tannophilus NRRL Y-2460]
MTNSNYLIGIDVGGTNTDSVLVDPALMEESVGSGVIAWNKSVTTADVSDGIEAAIAKLFESAPHVPRKNVRAVTIGTTHFINAIIEQDRSRLDKVAVLRLAGPYTRHTPAFSADFPPGLVDLMKGYIGYVDGGHRIDGNEIRKLDEVAIRDHCQKIKELGIRSVAIIGIFANLKPEHELRAQKIVLEELGENVNVVVSHEISGINFIERENATILNASIINFAKTIINSFLNAVRKLGFTCPLFLTQNNGTVLTVEEARKCAIRTFSSGATNSMRGAKYLCSSIKEIKGKSVIIGDVGGTTLDVGLLLPTGFPRLSSSFSTVGGVRMNFSMPFVESVGLGGGSIVRTDDKTGELSIGPDSVGADIVTRSLVFGGDVVTTTDVTVSVSEEELSIGNSQLVSQKFSNEFVEKFNKVLVHKLEAVVDKLRTSPDPLPLILVGGGSFIIPHDKVKVEGVSLILRPQFYQVANAIGAAMGKLSSDIHHVQVVDNASTAEREKIVSELVEKCTDQIVKKGAVRKSVEVVDISVEPVPYVDKTFSFKIQVVGDVDYERLIDAFDKEATEESNLSLEKEKHKIYKDSAFSHNSKTLDKQRSEEKEEIDYATYRPTINKDREWIISKTDLDFLKVGTYILGCGGGGNPYPHYIDVLTRMNADSTDVVKVVDYKDALKYATDGIGGVVTVGSAGSPTVGCEQLKGDEFNQSFNLLADYVGKKPDAVMNLEIGGGNGFASLWCGLKSNFDIPVIDCDLMGRAYPTLWQTLPLTLQEYEDGSYFTPSAFSDGNMNKMVIQEAQNDVIMENIIRASLSEIGGAVAVVTKPAPMVDLKTRSVHNSLSLAWRIGKAVLLARSHSEIENLPSKILDSIGGNGIVGKLLFRGKIIGVDRKLFKGHIYGEVIIENESLDKLRIPFKNENISADLLPYDSKNASSKDSWETICSVPDLITVCDANTGDAVGTQDYRYGLQVFVLGIAPSNLWTDTEKAIEIGGPKSFGPMFQSMVYKPIGKYIKPVSVIDEYAS